MARLWKFPLSGAVGFGDQRTGLEASAWVRGALVLTQVGCALQVGWGGEGGTEDGDAGEATE